MKNDLYNSLTDDQKQICDFCSDWQLGECSMCEFVKEDKNDIQKSLENKAF